MNTTWSGCLHMAVAGAGEASETARRRASGAQEPP